MNKATLKRIEAIEQAAAEMPHEQTEMTDGQLCAAMLDWGIELDPAQRELARTATPYNFQSRAEMSDEELTKRLRELGVELNGGEQ